MHTILSMEGEGAAFKQPKSWEAVLVFFSRFSRFSTFRVGASLEQISSKEEKTLQRCRCWYHEGSYPNEKDRFCLKTVCQHKNVGRCGTVALVLPFFLEIVKHNEGHE